MRAVICTKYGPPEVLTLQDIEKPIPGDNEILVKIHASSVHIGDTKIRSFKPGLGAVQDFLFKPLMAIIIGFRGPRKKILGMELAGEIESIGKNVSKFKVGDQVFAASDRTFGAYAEYKCLPEDGIVSLKPVNISYGEAATVPNGCMTALLILRKANIQNGQKVLIYGASGSVGTFAVQLARYMGAEVTGVCSTDNMEMVKSIGAKHVIDYTREDFTQNDGKYDVVFDAYGKFPKTLAKTSLKESGFYLNVLSTSNDIKLKAEDLVYLKNLIEENHLKPVIDRQYSLEEIVEAHRYVDQGHKKGNVILSIIS